MIDPQMHRRRPADTGTPSTETLKSPQIRPDSIDLARALSRGTHAVYVAAERADGTVVRQLYTSLRAGEAKVERTLARGLRAEMRLVRITPVPEPVALELWGEVDG